MRSMDTTKHAIAEVRYGMLGIRCNFESLYDIRKHQKHFRTGELFTKAIPRTEGKWNDMLIVDEFAFFVDKPFWTKFLWVVKILRVVMRGPDVRYDLKKEKLYCSRSTWETRRQCGFSG